MRGELYRVIEQEAHVVRSCLATGLTELRNANLNERGRFYSAFFQLANGIERLAKLALILDHMAQNSMSAPGQAAVRGYGHDLQRLIAMVSAAVVQRGYSLGSPFPTDPLCARMLRFLSEFATGMRYANLDGLASGNRQRDPLDEWNEILQEAANLQLNSNTRRRINERAAGIATALTGFADVLADDLAGEPLTIRTALSEPAILDAASKYMVWEVLTLLSPLRDATAEAGKAAHHIATSVVRNGERVPVLREFFDFIWLDRKYALRKKRWP